MKILVVEDNVLIADCLAEGLLYDGHVVCGPVDCVADGVALARLHRPDIAILDMQLRGRECGSEIADQLKESGDLGSMGILYITGEAERVQREARVGHACLSKPYTLTTLATALEIIRELALGQYTPRPLPRGLSLLRSARPGALAPDRHQPAR